MFFRHDAHIKQSLSRRGSTPRRCALRTIAAVTTLSSTLVEGLIMKHAGRCCAIIALLASAGTVANAAPYSVVNKPASVIAVDLATHRVTAVALVKAYEARIAEINPKIHAVIALNPRALGEARASDARRALGKTLGPLDGIPILVKDNIGIADLPTTAGSLALAKNVR